MNGMVGHRIFRAIFERIDPSVDSSLLGENGNISIREERRCSAIGKVENGGHSVVVIVEIHRWRAASRKLNLSVGLKLDVPDVVDFEEQLLDDVGISRTNLGGTIRKSVGTFAYILRGDLEAYLVFSLHCILTHFVAVSTWTEHLIDVAVFVNELKELLDFTLIEKVVDRPDAWVR